MYYTNHWVIDWDKVKSFDDLKRIVAMLDITFDYPVNVSSVVDLVHLERKDTPKITPL